MKTTTEKLKLSKAEKEKLCRAWRDSGLSKNEFARQNGISNKTFCNWCTELWPKEINSRYKASNSKLSDDWLEIKPTQMMINPKVANIMSPSSIEIKLPNGVVIGLSISIP